MASHKRSHDDRRTGTGGFAGALGELMDVFQPSREHLVTELERQRHDLHQTPSGAPDWDVDLESGRAVLRRPSEDG